MRTPNLLSALLVLSLGLSGSVSAHGFHYDLDVASQLQEDSAGRLTGVRMNWFYDTEVTKSLLEGEDMSASKQAETLQTMAQRAIADLSKLHYFTDLTLSGQALANTPATDYHMDLLPDGHLNLNFLLPLKTPQDMAGKQLDIALSDSTGSAILMYQDANRIGLGEKLSAACKLVLEEKQQYADGEAPQLVHIQCH
jgi:ABC-type uncharacterized transport system substrate-binding protein